MFSKQAKQLGLRIANVYNLLNSIKSKDYTNNNNKSRSFLKRAIDSLDSTTTLILFLTKLLYL